MIGEKFIWDYHELKRVLKKDEIKNRFLSYDNQAQVFTRSILSHRLETKDNLPNNKRQKTICLTTRASKMVLAESFAIMQMTY